MSISWGTQYAKLKTNLRLAINRLKLVEKKKTEMALKSRGEIADFIAEHKEDRARIRVEHIIREDFLVEAYELLEMYCDLLLARFGLIQQMKQLDDGIAEAVISILWAAPRVATDISEFKIISDQLTLKYGKPFAEAARANQLEFPAKVAPKLIAKLSVQAPPKLLVERYLIEIAKSAGIPFTPDPNVMREDEVAAAEQMLIDFKNQGGQGYGWMYPGGGNQGGNSAVPPPGPPPDGNASGGYYPGPPPPPPGGFGSGGYGGPDYGLGGGSGGYKAPLPQMPTHNGGAAANVPFNYPRLSQTSSDSDDITKLKPSPNTGVPSAPPASAGALPPKMSPDELDFPEPPSDSPFSSGAYPSPNGPAGSAPGAGGVNPPPGDDLDFDDLAKRFDQLKKKGNK